METVQKTITAKDIYSAALSLDVDPKAVDAVLRVETNGKGFLDDGRPKILFERHVFRKYLVQKGLLPDRPDTSIIDIAAGGYQGGVHEWTRMNKAILISREGALQSASWGLFQIMGYQWQRLGYSNVQDFVNAMYRSERDHLAAFSMFVKTDANLWKALKAHDWQTFAKNYNGIAYKKNQYDEKLASAFSNSSYA